jgi:hypothetical protein
MFVAPARGAAYSRAAAAGPRHSVEAAGALGRVIVRIGDATISRAALNHWLAVANDTNQASSGVKAAPLPLPPDYTACIKAQQAAAGNTRASKSAGEVAAEKATCETNYRTLVTEVLNYLIPRMWAQGEAASLNIHVTPAQIEKAYEQERKASRPPLTTRKELRDFLAASGEAAADQK